MPANIATTPKAPLNGMRPTAHRLSILRGAAITAGFFAALSGCNWTDIGNKAPFEATPAPAVYEPPEAGAGGTDVATKPKTELVNHIYGEDAYPCEGEGCDVASPKDGMLSFSGGGAEFIDPSKAGETAGYLVINNIFEGLIGVARQSGGELEQGVATEVGISEDGLTYTFKLRKDAKWSDGKPVTAHDFVYSWRRKLSPETASVSATNLHWLKNGKAFNEGTEKDPTKLGVRADGDHVLVATLENPTPFWLSVVAGGQYAPVPKHAVDAHGEKWTRPENIVSNGPYVLTEWKPRDRMEFRKNPHYWDKDNVKIPGARLSIVESSDAAMTFYESGQHQWLQYSLPTDRVPVMINSGRKDLFIDPYLCVYFYQFRVDRPPFDNPKLRKAIHLAIDRARLVQHVTRGMQQPADGLVMPSFVQSMGYPKPDGESFNPQAARAMMKDAGYPGGKGLPKLTLLYNTSDGHRLIAEFVQRSLKENLGIEVSLENMEWKSLLKRLRTGDYQFARSAWCSDPHPYTVMDFLLSYSAQNDTGWKNQQFDDLMKQARETVDPAKQLKLIADAEQVVQAELPVTPVYYYTRGYLRRPVLGGLKPELTNNHPIKYMWWRDKPGAPPATRPLAIDQAGAAAAAPDTPVKAALAEHIYGDDAYPCDHPTCKEPSPADGTLGIGAGGAEFIDPNLVTETEGFLVVDNTFENLISPAPRSGMGWQKGVATRWEVSDDALTYTFHLRDNAKWSNGRTVVAEDFRYSWLRKLNPDTGSNSAEQLHWMKGAKAYNQGKGERADVGIKAVDDRTLVVTLERPTPFFLNYIATSHYAPVPREVIEAHGQKWTQPENFVSNGPYVLTEWKQRVRMVLEKSKTYWDRDNVRIPRVVLYEGDEASETNRYKTGVVQWGRNAVRTDDIPDLIKSGRPDFFIDPYLCYYFYHFQNNAPPFDKVDVRRAFNMAIDKRRLVQHVARGMQVPADGPVLPHFESTLGYPKPEGDQFNPAKARELLTKAGYPGGKGLPPVTLIYNTYESHRLIGEFVQRSLKENLGVELSIENMEWKSLLKRVREKDFQMARSGWCGTEHPDSFLNTYLSTSANNHSGFNNPTFDALIMQARQTLDVKKQMAIYAEAEALVQREMPTAPIYYYTKTYLKKPVLRGLEPELNNTHLVKYMYWADKPNAP